MSYVAPVKSKVKISQNFAAFSGYMNFTIYNLRFPNLLKRSLNSIILSVDGTIPELQDRKSSTPSTSKPVPVLDSPCSVASDGSSTNWNGIPRVRRKWVDVVEGKLTQVLAEIFLFLYNNCLKSRLKVFCMQNRHWHRHDV